MAETGYSRSPKLIKGALIQFSAPMLIPIPNIIVFQYNPETMTRTLSPWKPHERAVYATQKEAEEAVKAGAGVKLLNELAQPFNPDEAFSLTLELDATDALEEPDTHPVARIAGVADRISAMEMLCYPPSPDSVGGLLNVPVGVSVGAAASTLTLGNADVIPRLEVPIVLFFWGPGRIVPVRVTTFSVEEQQYSTWLYPVRAKVSIGLTVLNEEHLVNVAGESSTAGIVDLAKACYKFTQGQKKVLAAANLVNTFESIGLLPI
jgi:hypothetical protein